MSEDWPEHNYHGYRIRSQVVPYPQGDYERWAAKVLGEDDRTLFQYRLTVSRTELVMRDVMNEHEFLQLEGMKRVHARLDFGEFAPGMDCMEAMSSTGDESSHPYHEPFVGLFATPAERLEYHILRVLVRSAEQSPGRPASGDFDLNAWAYYLAVRVDDFTPTLRRLHEERAIDAGWVPSPEVHGAYKLASGPSLTAIGARRQQEMEQTLIERRRTAAMPDLEDSAYMVARILYDHQFVGARMIVVRELRPLTGLSAADFDAADDFLRGAGYCHGTMGGDAGLLSLSTDGIAFVQRKLAERFELSRSAEQLARFLAERQQSGKAFVIASEIKAAHAWEDPQYFAAAEELIDEGIAEERLRADNARFLGLALTTEGRRAIRRNFRRPNAPVAFQMRDQIRVENYGDSVAIAAGESASATHGLSGSDAAQLFQSVYQLLDKRQDLSPDDKSEIKDTVELIEGEVTKGEQANEKALTLYMRNLARMAPDILEVALAAATNPVLAAATIVRKVAEKAKRDAGG